MRTDPHGQHLLVLADGPSGYGCLSAALSLGISRGRRGRRSSRSPISPTPVQMETLVGPDGLPKGIVPAALLRDGPAAAARRCAS
jgi:error-prone DNA polymerase